MNTTSPARATRLLRLYPRAWRERYGEEFAALLGERPASPRDTFDIVLGALDAHLRPRTVLGRIPAMLNRLRANEIAVFCAYIAFVVAGLGFQKMTEYDDFQELARAHPAVGVPYYTIVLGSGVALVAILAGGIPIALDALRFALRGRRWDILGLFAVPALAFAALVGDVLLIEHRATPPAPPASATPAAHDVIHFGVLLAIFFVGAIASTAAVSAAIARSQVSPRVYRFALWPATAATLAMVGMLAALVAWGLAVRATSPQLFTGDDGVFATSTALSWLGQVALMAVAVVVAVVALARAYRARGGDSAPASVPA